MLFKKLVVFLLLSLSCALSKINAQVYTFKNYTQDNGLPQSYIYDLSQGKNGFLFISTGEGLGTFGGYKFKKFGIKDSLAENFIYSTFLDSKGILWIGHFQNGVSYLKDNVFHRIKSSPNVVSKITSFVEDKSGNIYFSSGPGGVYKIKADSISPFVIDQLPNIHKMVLYKNKLILATQNGLYTINLQSQRPNVEIVPQTKNTNITSIDIDKDNSGIWIGSEKEGLSFLQFNDNNFNLCFSIKEELNSGNFEIRDIKKVKQTLWVSIYGDGLRLIDLKAKSFLPERIRKVNTENGLQSAFITKIFEDREGNIWLGSFGEGLFQFISARFEFYTKNNGLPFDNVVSIALHSGNNLVLLNSRSLCFFNTINDETSASIPLNDLAADDAITCSYYDKENKLLLIGTKKSGIALVELNPPKNIIKKKCSFNQGQINYITKNKTNNTYYICTNDGLFITDLAFNIVSAYNTNNGLPHNSLTGCFIDKNARLWLFSPETPLYFIEKDSVTLLKDIVGLNSFKFINAIQDDFNNTWFCTEGDGVLKYNGKTFTPYTTQNGLLSDYGYFIVKDKQNNIVIGHKNGISIKHNNKKDFTGVDKTKGLILLEYNQNSGITDDNDNFWFGSSKGLIKYNSSLDKTNTLSPALNLLSISLNNEAQNIKDSVYNFSYDEYSLTINFIGISLTDPAGVTYRYKLDGIDKEWRTTNERIIEYPLLKDGNFEFILYSSNSDGFETGKPIKFKIIVDKPIWKKTWFYLILIFVVLEFFYLIYVFRTRALRRQNLILEKKVEAKTIELIKEKEYVEATNKLLEEKNNDILDSINYAERIQNALLPKKEIIELYVNSFIFYKPRDIVSGDFYWYHIKNGLIYVAVVDCTGHGVPGAFMSIIGSTLLDQVTSELNAPLPGEILNSLNFKVNRSLKQYEAGSESHDGMDLVLCRLDTTKQELYFAGARRPLYILRNGVLNEMKGAIEPVGGHVFSIAKNFESHLFHYEKGDMVYLFSDGYVDQFGGNNNTKYLSKNFKNLLLSIADKTLEEQKYTIDQEFRRWKGSMAQIDDILIWGIRL